VTEELLGVGIDKKKTSLRVIVLVAKKRRFVLQKTKFKKENKCVLHVFVCFVGMSSYLTGSLVGMT